MVSRRKHENVLELVSYCVEEGLRVPMYEFATMGSLHDILHGKGGLIFLILFEIYKIVLDMVKFFGSNSSFRVLKMTSS